MPLSDITDPGAIRAAMAEYDNIGQKAFLNKYGFGRARRYYLKGAEGKTYDSKAVVGAAHGYQFPDQGPLRSSDFSGGDNTVKALLERLGYKVTGPESPPSIRPDISHATRVWVEKTIVRERQDRQSGPHRLGQALWSPQKAVDGRDIYANMLEVLALSENTWR